MGWRPCFFTDYVSGSGNGVKIPAVVMMLGRQGTLEIPTRKCRANTGGKQDGSTVSGVPKKRRCSVPESKMYMLFKGAESTEETESAVISYTADDVVATPDGRLIFGNKDGSAGLECKLLNGARLREV